MNPMADQSKLRREYVWRKSARLLRLILAISAVLSLWGAGVIAVIPFFMQWSNPPRPFIIPVEAYVLLIVFGLLGYGAWRILKRAEWDYEMVAYAPPISVETLPAGEILVRGSEVPPVAQSEVLLRATTGIETPKDELLRMIEH